MAVSTRLPATLLLLSFPLLFKGLVAFGEDNQAPQLVVNAAILKGTFGGTGANPGVAVNGEGAQVNGQSWSKEAALQEGENRFEAIASGANGKSQPRETVINVGAAQSSTGGAGDDLNPQGNPVGDGTPYDPMRLRRLKLKVNFKTASADTVMLQAYLRPPDGLSFEGQSVIVDIGGASWTLQLDAKGRARSTASRLKIKTKKPKKGSTTPGDARVLFKARGADAAAFWRQVGLTNETVKGRAVSVPALVTLGGKTYGIRAGLTYKAKGDVKGLAK